MRIKDLDLIFGSLTSKSLSRKERKENETKKEKTESEIKR